MNTPFVNGIKRLLVDPVAIACLVLGVAVTFGALPAGAAPLPDEVRRDVAWLAAGKTRLVGTPEHDAAFAQLLDRLHAAPGVTVWTQTFPVVVPQLDHCVLTIARGPLAGSHPIYPVWPDLVRLKTTPTNGIAGTLNYVGPGDIADIKPLDIKGNIAVMEMASYENWRNPFQFGATAVLLLAGREPVRAPPSVQSLYLPRYYVQEGPLADALRRGEVGEARIDCAAAWVEATAANAYALVLPPGYKGDPRPIVLAAQFDGMSTIMGLAPGADAAVDSALLLNLVHKYAAAPPAKPVLFAFVDAYGINQLGMRRMLGMLAALPGQPDRQKYEKEDATRIEDGEKAVALFDELAGGADREIGEQALHPFSRSRYRVVRSYFKDRLSPELLALEEELSSLRLTGVASPERAAAQGRIDALSARRARLNTIRNQVFGGRGVDADLSEETVSILRSARACSRRELAENRQAAALYERDDGLRAAINGALGSKGPGEAPVSFLLGVDLSDAGITVGPQLVCGHWRFADPLAVKDFLRWLRSCVSQDSMRVWDDDTVRAVNRPSIIGSDDAWSFIPDLAPALTGAAGNFGVPAATWATLEAFRRKVDTPFDDAAGLDWSRLTPQIAATAQLIDRMLNGSDFVMPAKPGLRPQWRRVSGTIVDVSVGDPVPSVPMAHFLATAEPNTTSVEAPGVRRTEFQFTGTDGGFRLEGLPAGAQEGLRGVHVEAFRLAADGSIVRAAKKVTGQVRASQENPGVNLTEPLPTPMRAVVFDCVELNGPRFFDSRYMVMLWGLDFIDRVRGGAPEWSNVSIVDGQLHALVRKDILWQAILREGAAGTRMALVNLSDPGKCRDEGDLRKAMNGYRATESPVGPPAYLSVLDFHGIDEWRLGVMRAAGIRVPPVDRMVQRAAQLIKEAGAALAANNAAGMFRASLAAMAFEVRAHETIRTTNDDVVRGAIFLLLLLVPFAVVMEQLLVASVDIVRRIAWASGIFMAMAVVLWGFHPAFRISSQPLVILMSFSILSLSAVVIAVVMTRFGAFLDEIRRGRAEARGAETGRGGLVGSAVWLGIGNMRKRRFRTALTATTIMLITFALLCFSSARNYTEKRQYRIAAAGPVQASVLVRQPGLRVMPRAALMSLRAMLGGEHSVVPRCWLVNRSGRDWRINLRNPGDGRYSAMKGLVGLAPEESQVSPIGSLVRGWDRFSRGGGCYLARTTAQALGVKPGDRVVLAGLELEVIDTYDPRALAEAMRQLDGTSILPIDYAALDARQASQTRDQSVTERTQETLSFSDVKLDQQMPVVAADEVAIVHERECRLLGGETRTLAIPVASSQAANTLAADLVDTLAFPVYYGGKEGVNVAVAVPLLPKAPRSLLIPLAIAALIILNTMMNSVAERRGEIHVYTSLGLAPRHVGALFIAEAGTYGLLGSIFGYVVGQGLASVLTKFNVMGNITLNYSGTQVIMTMGLVLAVTMLSGIIPAIVASRVATPSHAASWSLPAPVDGVIRDVLPFTATPVAADGLVAFIYEYMEAHKDGAIGNFTCDELSRQSSGREKVIVCSVWLAPYDLGVKQDMRLTIRQVEEDVSEIGIELRRLTGEESSWRKLGKPFVADLRRQFLGWHKLTAERVTEYIRNASA